MTRIVLCDCMGSQRIDADALSEATGLPVSRVHRALCTDELPALADMMQAGEVVVACAQEAQLFAELAEELGQDAPACVDIRDRAGWSDDLPTPKMAALLAESLLPAVAVKTVDVLSEGTCLIIGASNVALPAAATLSGALAVTVLVTDPEPQLARGDYEVVCGHVSRLSGSLGNFVVRIDGFRALVPGGRGAFGFSTPRDGAETRCDVVLDLSGSAPLVPEPDKRDGYLRADPGRPADVAGAVFQAAQHVGTFEKPLYVRLTEHLCAHSRAGQLGCNRCLDACPTGAITPAGDHVSVDPLVCAGCGACAALCPSAAITYDAPPVDSVFRRLQVLAETYRKAGGVLPRLLVHDTEHGAEMIRLSARHGRGLPGDVIPLSVSTLAGFGHAETLAALALGFQAVAILPAPSSDRATISRELALAAAMGADGRATLLDTTDPEVLSDVLYGARPQPLQVAPILPLGSRRQVARLAARALNAGATAPLPLPDGAPYGAVLVDTDACTLCLSCASLCPSGALLDNPDMPQLRFQEDACLQCGLCARVCPENAITLRPQFDPTEAALAQQVLNEEEPFCCIECGKPFGVASTIGRIMEKLAGKHPMFADTAAGRLIQMCDDCRVQAQYHAQNNPLAGGDRPRVRTTDDYLTKRRDH